MTTLEKVKPSAGRRAPAAMVVGLPQVNLLPPEVRSKRSLGVVKRWLAIGLVLTVVLISVVYIGAVLLRSGAEDRLADAEATTADLQAEASKYAEVPRVLGQLASTTQARGAGFGTEVLWKQYLDAVTAVLPEGVSIDSFTITGPSPVSEAVPPSNPLMGPSIGSLTFEVRSTALPNTAGWVDALASVPGFADPWVSTTTVADDGVATYFQVSSSVQITDATLAKRFALTTDEEN